MTEVWKTIRDECGKLSICTYKDTGCSDCLVNQTFNKIENELEKQIPKKPKITRNSACITFGICPNCGTEIDCLDNPFYHIDSDCLQKLDWSDV